jgi:hypothetical protein
VVEVVVSTVAVWGGGVAVWLAPVVKDEVRYWKAFGPPWKKEA